MPSRFASLRHPALLCLAAAAAGCASPSPPNAFPADGGGPRDLGRRDQAPAPAVDLAIQGPTDGAPVEADLAEGPDLAPPPDLAACTPQSCAAPTPLCDPDSGRCVPCLPINDLCPRGAMCVKDNLRGYKCMGQCEVDKDCPAPQPDGGAPPKPACCAFTCADVANDPMNCGACGTSCKGGACCAGACADTAGDPMNCGGCGRLCAGKNAMWTCVNGNCMVGACQMGFGDCNKDPADGCETSLVADGKNCGACGKACQANNAVVACEMGVCKIAQCNPGYGDCNQDGSDGCEANLQSSPMSCGACGKSCPAPQNGQAVCKAGVCSLAGCLPGWGDCDGNQGNGCEVRTDNDLAHCGGCNRSCQIPHGTPACQGGKCLVAGCGGSWRDCNNLSADGCEVDVTVDTNNCGQCGKRCALANARAMCQGGGCVVQSCSAPYGDCNGLAADGCESNLLTDNRNCGNCGTACGGNTQCKSGSCQPVVAFVGAYSIGVGPRWTNNPPTYSCLEACAIRFGGNAAQYQCSTNPNNVTRTAWVDGYADVLHCPAGSAANAGNAPVAETYKKAATYNCGVKGCAYSAYVSDNCPTAINYCFR